MKLLTIAEAARDLSACARTVHRLIDTGQLAVVELTASKRGRRINPDALENFKKGSIYQSENAATAGRSTSAIVPLASELDELLGLASKPSSLNQKSARPSKNKPSLTAVSSTRLPSI